MSLLGPLALPLPSSGGAALLKVRNTGLELQTFHLGHLQCTPECLGLHLSSALNSSFLLGHTLGEQRTAQVLGSLPPTGQTQNSWLLASA